MLYSVNFSSYCKVMNFTGKNTMEKQERNQSLEEKQNLVRNLMFEKMKGGRNNENKTRIRQP